MSHFETLAKGPALHSRGRAGGAAPRFAARGPVCARHPPCLTPGAGQPMTARRIQPITSTNSMNGSLTSRRGFLKLSAAVSTLAALAPAALKVSESDAAAPVRKRDLRKAIMGATIGLEGSLVEKYKTLKEAGFEGVEPMSHMKQDEVLEALEKSGLKAASVCCATHWNETLSHPNQDTRDRGLDGLKQALRDASRYGATSVLLVPGVVNKEVTYEQCW